MKDKILRVWIFLQTKWKTKHCECRYFFKQKWKTKIVNVEKKNGRPKHCKCGFFFKQNKKQNIMSMDFSSKKIKDKRLWVDFSSNKNETQKTLWVLDFLQMKQNTSFFILRVVFSSNNDIRQEECVWFFFKQKSSCFHCLERAGEDDNRDPRKEG